MSTSTNTSRRRLPPGARKVTLQSGVIRYELTVDIGPDHRTGDRRQKRTRFATEEELLAAYATTRHQVAAGTYVVKSRITVEQVCDDYLAGRHSLSANTLANYRDKLKPFRDRHGAMAIQSITKRHLDDLVTDLAAGYERTNGTRCKPWGPSSVNQMLTIIRMAVESAMQQGLVVRNVAMLVDRTASKKRKLDTFTAAEVTTVLAAAAADRNEHAWHLALSGLRREEIAGLRWRDVNFAAGTLTVENARVSVDGQVHEKGPKSKDSGRTLPLTQELTRVLRLAQTRQKTERLAFGSDYQPSGYVMVNEAGAALHPETITDYWFKLLRSAGARRIRLHEARHTCGTLMHLQGVPIVVISAWLGHFDPAFTLRTYAHSQPDALGAAADVLGALMAPKSVAV